MYDVYSLFARFLKLFETAFLLMKYKTNIILSLILLCDLGRNRTQAYQSDTRFCYRFKNILSREILLNNKGIVYFEFINTQKNKIANIFVWKGGQESLQESLILTKTFLVQKTIQSLYEFSWPYSLSKNENFSKNATSFYVFKQINTFISCPDD